MLGSTLERHHLTQALLRMFRRPRSKISDAPVPQSFRGRHGYVIANPEGRYVFLSPIAHEVYVRLRRGVAKEEIEATLPDVSPQRVQRLVETLGSLGFSELEVPGDLNVPTTSEHPRSGQQRQIAWLLWLLVVVAVAVGAAGIPRGSSMISFDPPTLTAGAIPERLFYGFVWIVGLGLHALVHESAHLCTSWMLGARTRGMSFRLIGIFPAVVSKVSGAWLLPRGERILIALVGPATSFAFGGVLSFALPLISNRPNDVQSLVASWMSFSYLVGALSLNPFLRMDGYFALSHALDIPNLASRALAALRKSMKLRRITAPWFVLFALAMIVTRSALILVLLLGILRNTRQSHWGTALFQLVVLGGLVWASRSRLPRRRRYREGKT
ncbi:MAG: hypothetical protein ACRDZO_13915 [Egibacteraceae bacterium]